MLDIRIFEWESGLDDSILPALMGLWEKGIPTRESCGGHLGVEPKPDWTPFQGPNRGQITLDLEVAGEKEVEIRLLLDTIGLEGIQFEEMDEEEPLIAVTFKALEDPKVLPWRRCYAPGHSIEDWIRKYLLRDTPGQVKSGKWLIYTDLNHFHSVWNKIKEATEKGQLGTGSKISNPESNYLSMHQIICVYTYDWEDKADVYRVLAQLRKLGFGGTLAYKTDTSTLKGEYGKGVSKYKDPPHPPSYYFKLAQKLVDAGVDPIEALTKVKKEEVKNNGYLA